MKILIIAFYYPPEDSWAKMASLRPHSWAKHWSQMGHQVYVLTAHRPLSGDQTTGETVVGVKSWPSRSAQDSGSKQTPSRLAAIKAKGRSLLQTGLRASHQWLGLGSFLQTSYFWLLPAVKQSQQLHQQVKFDLVVSTYGPPANPMVAARLKRSYSNLLWVADYRDLWHGNDYTQLNPIVANLENQLERWTMASADIVTTVSQGISEVLGQRLQIKTYTIENGFDEDDLNGVEPVQWPNRKVRLLYTGAIYPKKRDPEPLIKALTHLRTQRTDIDTHLEVLFFGWNLEPLRQRIVQAKLESIVTIANPCPRQEILRLQCSVDALIFLDWQNPSVNGILTGKLYEYIFAGRPIIGIGATPATAAGRLMLDLGVGHPVGNDPAAIAALLTALLEGHSLPYTPQHDKIQQYTRKNLAHRLLDIMVEAKARSANP